MSLMLHAQTYLAWSALWLSLPDMSACLDAAAALQGQQVTLSDCFSSQQSKLCAGLCTVGCGGHPGGNCVLWARYLVHPAHREAAEFCCAIWIG